MHKILMFLALGAFLSVSVANACDSDKASAKGKTHSSCCMKAKKASACMTKNGKDCTKDPSCAKGMKATKNSPKKDAGKS